MTNFLFFWIILQTHNVYEKELRSQHNEISGGKKLFILIQEFWVRELMLLTILVLYASIYFPLFFFFCVQLHMLSHEDIEMCGLREFHRQLEPYKYLQVFNQFSFPGTRFGLLGRCPECAGWLGVFFQLIPNGDWTSRSSTQTTNACGF